MCTRLPPLALVALAWVFGGSVWAQVPHGAGAGSSHAIPFSLGDNDKIYVKGRINHGPELDLQVDLGAGGSLINRDSVAKVGMRLDGTIRLRNSDGDNEVPSSRG